MKPRLLGSAPTAIHHRICPSRPRLLQHYGHQPATTLKSTLFLSIRLQRGFSGSRLCFREAQPLKDTGSPPPPPPPSPRSRRSPLLLTVALLAGGTVYWATAGSSSGSFDDNGQRRLAAGGGVGLNPETFVPFAVVAREEVSPTAFVLTLRLPEGVEGEGRAKTVDAIMTAWQHGLWSVEVKQPQLQIARDYTPLPKVEGNEKSEGEGEGDNGTELRLFVRVVPGGEVSKYLSRRAVGSTVDLRGPRLSFDVAARVGQTETEDAGKEKGDTTDDKQVVVLAGGTGISTALQAAHAVLGRGASVSILWANRQQDDSIGLIDKHGDNAVNPIVRDIQKMQTRYGAGRLRVHSFVDAQQTLITETAVRRAMEGIDGAGSGRAWYWPWGTSSTRVQATPTGADTTNAACVYHSTQILERMEADAVRGSAKAKACSCATTGPPGSAGKNLVLVSGPDGFIAAWAGAKTWAGGQERQGPVLGILGYMAARDPQTFARWQVLKL
jgi:NAD(P)H-flavin reductase